jgi:peptidoglycan/LPS O-acetylase OafA/YrhL
MASHQEAHTKPTKAHALGALLWRNYKDLFEKHRGRYPTLDGLRAIAVLLVILFHCFYLNITHLPQDSSEDLIRHMAPWFNWIWQGDKGVDLFFVLSGFLISMLLLREHQHHGKVDVLRFYRRRAARILPAYILILGTAWFAHLPHREWIWSNLLFINNLQPANTYFVPWTWSIAVEVQFYLLFPIMLLPIITKLKHPFLFTLALSGFVMIARQLILFHHPQLSDLAYYEIMFSPAKLQMWWDTLYIPTASRLGPIMLGITAGTLHIYHAESLNNFSTTHPKRYSGLAFSTFLLMLGILTVPIHAASLHYDAYIGQCLNSLLLGQHRILFSICIAVLLVLSLHPPKQGHLLTKFLSSNLLTPIAKASYSAYLIHIPVIWWVFGAYRKTPSIAHSTLGFVLATAVTLFVIFLISTIMYAIIEKPFIDASHRKH